MNPHVTDLLPFYVNQTLGEEDRARVLSHLAGCRACQRELAGWEMLASAAAAPGLAPLPPLSPLVQASLGRRPPPSQAIRSALHLISAQRVFLAQTWLLPTLGSLILLSILATLAFQNLASSWANIPLLVITPAAAALATAFLSSLDDDQAYELVATLPTSLSTLLFARLTFALAAISLLGFAGSLLSAVLGQATTQLFGIVAIWLGPMLLLAAFTTVLSLVVHPSIASGASLALWGITLIILFSERAGVPLIKFSLLWLAEPGWAVFGGQVLLAGLLWLGAWLWLSSSAPAPLRPEGRP